MKRLALVVGLLGGLLVVIFAVLTAVTASAQAVPETKPAAPPMPAELQRVRAALDRDGDRMRQSVWCCTLFGQTYDAQNQVHELIQEKVLPIVEAQAGCICAFVDLLHNAPPVILGVSVWKPKADAERYRREY